MTKTEPTIFQPISGLTEAWRAIRNSWIGRRPEIAVFMLLLAWLSLPVIAGSSMGAYVFKPADFLAVEWWRLVTHPFVHVSWYHLLLDGSAFFMLYHSLAEKSVWRRLCFVLGGALGSALIAWGFSPATGIEGLCGLSGIAHGLMAVSAVEQMSASRLDKATARLGLFTFLFVVGKAGFEAASGHLFFSWLHFGLLGNPILVSHAGGIIGSLLVLILLECVRRRSVSASPYIC